MCEILVGVFVVRVVHDIGGQCPSMIICVWVSECWLYVYITCECDILLVGNVLYSLCLWLMLRNEVMLHLVVVFLDVYSDHL